MSILWARPLSMRGDAAWRGMTTTTRNDIGDRRMRLLENVYPSSDGVDLRLFPGWKCVYDFKGVGYKAHNADGAGFYSYRIDGWRGSGGNVWSTVDDYKQFNLPPSNTQRVWTNPKHIHGFKRVRGRLIVWGEEDFRKERILSAGGETCYITSFSAASDCVLTFSHAPINGGDGGTTTAVNANYIEDSTKDWNVNEFQGPPDHYMVAETGVGTNVFTQATITSNTAVRLSNAGAWSNGTPGVGGKYWFGRSTGTFSTLRPGDIIFIEQLAGGGAGVTELSHKFHLVTKVDGTSVTISTATSAASGVAQTCGVYVVSRGISQQAAYPRGEEEAQVACDEPESIAIWASVEQPDVDTLRTECFPAQVFNKQRDFGDYFRPGMDRQEGSQVAFNKHDGTNSSVSRRRKRALPFRTVPDVAAGKLLLAAPGYGCVFQAPVVMGLDIADEGEDAGFTDYNANGIHDMIRSLGVPKASMIVDRLSVEGSGGINLVETTDSDLAWAGWDQWGIQNLHATLDTGITQSQLGTINSATSADDATISNWAVNEWASDYANNTITLFRHQATTFDVSGVLGVYPDIIQTNDANTLNIASPVQAALVTTHYYSLIHFVTSYVPGTANLKFDFEGTVSLAAGELKGKVIRYHDGAAWLAGTAYSTILDNGTDWIIIEGGIPDDFQVTSYPMLPKTWIDVAMPPDRGGVYKFKIAYRDTATGEVGLPSEELSLDLSEGAVDDEGVAVRLFALFPGYLMPETGALQIEVYRTKKDGDEFFFDSVWPMYATDPSTTAYAPGTTDTRFSSLFGIQPSQNSTLAYIHTTSYDVPFKTDEVLEDTGSRYVPSIEQMPAGATTVKTIRGVTLFGGGIGNSGKRLENELSQLTTRYEGTDTNYTRPNQITLRGGVSYASPFDGVVDGPWLCAGHALPTAYCGIGLKLFTLTGFPQGCQSVTIGEQLNNELGVDDNGDWAHQRVEIENAPFQEFRYGGSEGAEAIAELPIARYQWSQLGFPGVVPATNIGYVDADSEDGIQAIGAFNGGAVICTRSNTFYMNWADEPRNTPDLASNEFGCIAANTMVEFDGGAAWLSDRGPVAMTGDGVQWIGRDLEGYFVGRGARYKCDSQGMMRHSWACHDNERGLVYFGVFADRNESVEISFRTADVTWATASDQARSRFPCDEVLVWSYRTNSWSVWVPPEGLEVYWMERDFDADGQPRIMFCGADQRIYAFDDLFNDTNKDAVARTLTNAGSSGAMTFTTTIGTSSAALGAGENYVRVGMRVMLVRGSEPLFTGKIATIPSTTSVTVTWDDASAAWRVGDVLWIGVRSATVETNWFAATGIDKARDLGAVEVRYSLRSMHSHDTDNYDPQRAAIKVTVNASKAPNSIDAQGRTESVLTTDQNELGEWRNLGVSASDDEDTSQVGRFGLGKVSGTSLKAKLEIHSAAQVYISDMVVQA